MTDSNQDPGTAARFSPACERNGPPILQQLRKLLPSQAKILEIACGTGEHGALFCRQESEWYWQPCDIDLKAISSSDAHRSIHNLSNLQPALNLDVTQFHSQIHRLTNSWSAIYSANMIHIAPWEATKGLIALASKLLKPGGHLILYGPFFNRSEVAASSNQNFHQQLQARNPSWGIRFLEDLLEVSTPLGIHWQETLPMPANNAMQVFIRGPD